MRAGRGAGEAQGNRRRDEEEDGGDEDGESCSYLDLAFYGMCQYMYFLVLGIYFEMRV